MLANPRLLLVVAAAIGAYGGYTESTPLIIAAMVLAGIFLAGWMLVELRQEDPWAKHRKDARDDP